MLLRLVRSRLCDAQHRRFVHAVRLTDELQLASRSMRSAGDKTELRCASFACNVSSHQIGAAVEMSSAAKPEAPKPTAMPAPNGLNIRDLPKRVSGWLNQNLQQFDSRAKFHARQGLRGVGQAIRLQRRG